MTQRRLESRGHELGTGGLVTLEGLDEGHDVLASTNEGRATTGDNAFVNRRASCCVERSRGPAIVCPETSVRGPPPVS